MSTMTPPKTPNGDCGCKDKDKDNATQVSININRAALCKLLYDEGGTVSKLETKFDCENLIYKEKRCIFLNTEKSYRRYRNFEITTGTELVQTNVSVQANVAKLKDWNKTLNATLTNLSKQIKDLKTKFGDLQESAEKLCRAYNDKCNTGQKKAITGKGAENCPDGTPIDACATAATDIETLCCRPGGLVQDIDSIFQSSADVTGIQIFSNVDSLDQLQKDLQTKSGAFDKLISDTMKTRKADLDKLQDDLVASVKTITQAAVDRNAERAVFEGYYDAVKFLCCPACDCVSEVVPTATNNNRNNPNQSSADCPDDCPPRLKDCEKAICSICDDVKVTFCCEADKPVPPPQTPAPQKKGCD